jgi:hypothetical protein
MEIPRCDYTGEENSGDGLCDRDRGTGYQRTLDIAGEIVNEAESWLSRYQQRAAHCQYAGVEQEENDVINP